MGGLITADAARIARRGIGVNPREPAARGDSGIQFRFRRRSAPAGLEDGRPVEGRPRGDGSRAPDQRRPVSNPASPAAQAARRREWPSRAGPGPPGGAPPKIPSFRTTLFPNGRSRPPARGLSTRPDHGAGRRQSRRRPRRAGVPGPGPWPVSNGPPPAPYPRRPRGPGLHGRGAIGEHGPRRLLARPARPRLRSAPAPPDRQEVSPCARSLGLAAVYIPGAV